MSQQINLFNPIFLKRKKHFSALALAQSLGMIAAGLVAFYVYAGLQTAKLRQASSDLDARMNGQRDQLIRIGREFSPQGRSKLLEEELARSESRLKARQDMVERLRAEKLGSAEGFSPYLTAFARHSIAGLWLTGIQVGEGDGRLGLRGRVLHADLVPAYLRALSKDPVMQGRTIEELKLSAAAESEASGAPAAAASPPAAAPPANPEAAPTAANAEPRRFIEFSLVAPRRAAAEAPPAAPAPARKPGT